MIKNRSVIIPNKHKLLIDKHIGANPNMQLQDGRTALHFAATHGNKKTLQTLLQNGGDPHVVDEEGESSNTVLTF